MPYVYILSNKPNGTLYLGSTTDLTVRMQQHRTGHGGKFAGEFNLDKLVWFQESENLDDAQALEHRMKRWRRGLES